MAIDRRTFLALLGATPLLPNIAWSATPQLYISAIANKSGSYALAGMTPAGTIVFNTPLPGRGHSAAVSPDGKTAILFARRPGTFAVAFNPADPTAQPVTFTTPPGRHFYGHGVFSRDGTRLYTPENDFENTRGVIGIYDVTNDYARIGEMPSHGVGPHDVHLSADGETLIVANGGIATHPDMPRLKLNLPTMSPSLAYVDRRTGTLRTELRLPAELHQLSIRHLAVSNAGTIAIAMQYQGTKTDQPPLVAIHRPGAASLEMLDTPPDILRHMNNYCGSVALDASGTVLATTAPRGNLCALWTIADGTHFIGKVDMDDCCGIAATNDAGSFLLTSGKGSVAAIRVKGTNIETSPLAKASATAWDNHLIPA